MNWGPVTQASMVRVADRMSSADRREVQLSHGWGPWEAVSNSCRFSVIQRCIYGDNGDPVGLCGVTRTGVIWLLQTDALLQTAACRRRFARESRQWVEGLVASQLFPVLENWVLNRNVSALRWLRWLGFAVEPPEPMGPGYCLFHHAWRKSQW